jgi:polar amino acid transport system substrate-binding protein
MKIPTIYLAPNVQRSPPRGELPRPARLRGVARWAVLLLTVASATVSASSMPILRWAGDSEGGAPFIYQDPADPSKLVGAEVELMDLVGAQLGLKPVFVQNQWEGLIPGLDRGDYQVAVNAIEITPERQRQVAFSQPYFVTYEQLAVRRGETAINAVEDLKGKKVGTYKGALAQEILEERGLKPLLYEDIDPLYRDLGFGRLDAVLLDQPIALYVGKPLPDVKFVGDPVGQLAYGMALRKQDGALRARLDQALDRLRASGQLRKLWERWGLWNPLLAAQWHDHRNTSDEPVAWEQYLAARGATETLGQRLQRYVFKFTPLLLQGAWVTLQLSVTGMSLAIVLGLALALARLYGPWPLRWLSVAYVELFRGTPLLIQLFILFYGLPHFGIRLTPVIAAILGLGLNYAAYEAENYRAGLLAVPKGQMEAALALGMSRAQSLRHVLLPQAVRAVLPPVTNDFISILKDSSLVSVITMVELTKVYGELAATYYDWLGLGLLTALLYFLIGLPFVWLARRLETRLHPERQA